MTGARLLIGALVTVLMTTGSILTMRAQDHGSSSTTHVGDIFGDLIHIKRDAVTGQPILQEREVLLPSDILGTAYCPIPVDPAGLEVPFLPQSCDPDPAYLESLVEVDYFGRLSGGRTKPANLRMHFDEAIASIKNAEAVSLDEGGRLQLGTDCVSPTLCSSWRAIDSPQANMALYWRLMKYGHIQTDPLEEDTSPGGDPNAGTPYHPALDDADWAKFSGPVRAVLPQPQGGSCFAGAAFDASCAAPELLTGVDFIIAGSVLAGAADKTGRITPDLVQYMNRILKITLATPEAAATLKTLPALIRDDQGVITPAPPGLPAPADELFVDFAPLSYLRSDWFSKTVYVLQDTGGNVFVPTNVDLMTWLTFINGPKTATTTNMPAFVNVTSDALRTIEFIHEYGVPVDLWAVPSATLTTVPPVVAGYSTANQNVTLTAEVSSQNASAITGSVTFSVRTAASVAVGLPVTAAVSNGTATATYVLPGGTTPQVLTIVALFTPAGFLAESEGVGTLTVTAAPTTTVVLPASVPISSAPVPVTLSATVNGVAGDIVNEGTLAFTVRDTGGTVIGTPVSGPVVNGSVMAVFTVPGGLAAQRLTITGDYGGTAFYAPSVGTNQLAVGCLPVTILPATLPRAVIGQPYSQTFTTDGTAPTGLSLTGVLPAGLTFTTDTLSGTPTASGSFTFDLDAIDATGCTGTRTYTLEVNQLWAMVVGSGAGMEGVVRLLDANGVEPTGVSAPTTFMPFPETQFMNGLRVAMGDVTGDGMPDTLVALGPGGGPEIRVFDGKTGALARSFWAFDSWSGGGLFLATGDVDHDGVTDIIAAQGWGSAIVRVFSGATMTLLREFNAGAEFGPSGARVGAGDLNADGYADILVSSGPGVDPLIRVFSGATGALMAQLTGFDADLPGGLFVAAGDVNGDGHADIVAGAGEGTGSRVRVFDGVTLAQIRLFEAFEPWRLGGVRLACADVNGDGKAEIIAAPGPGDDPHVHVFDGQTGLELASFMVFTPGFDGGIYVGAGR